MARCRRDAPFARTAVEQLDLMNRDWLQAYKHSIRLQDMHGKTALDHAQEGGFELIVAALKDAENTCVHEQPSS